MRESWMRVLAVSLMVGGALAAVMIGCTAQQLRSAQQTAQQVQALTTQPVVAAAAAATPGGGLIVSAVGALAAIVGSIAGHLATRPALARSQSAAQQIAGALKSVQNMVTDPASQAAIQTQLNQLPGAVQTILAAAGGSTALATGGK